MSTTKFTSTSLRNRVARTWITQSGSASEPHALPNVRRIDPDEMPMPIGRDVGPSPGAYLIDDKLVSARHAELRYRESCFELADVGSTNGTFLNGSRVQEHASHPLKDGDLIQVGGTFLCFRTGIFEEVTLPKTPEENGPLVSVCPEFIEAVIELRKAALSPGTVLLLGETGTGKEVFAQALHEISRRPGRFIAINTASIQPTLVAAELFGVVKGAHSHANEDRIGLLRSADRGTVLLDEIGDMPLDIQANLLRAIQEKEVSPVGSDATFSFDARFIAATHRDPSDKSILRDDLFARLRAFTIRIPPLRDRIEDLGLLIGRLLLQRRATHLRFAADAYARLMLHDWTQNVRQLAHVLDYVVSTKLDEITADVMEAAGIPGDDDEESCKLPVSIDHVCMLLREHGGRMSKVARLLGIHRMRIDRALKNAGIDPDNFRARPRNSRKKAATSKA
jgi:DNA-binding NtrC family response regulator